MPSVCALPGRCSQHGSPQELPPSCTAIPVSLAGVLLLPWGPWLLPPSSPNPFFLTSRVQPSARTEFHIFPHADFQESQVPTCANNTVPCAASSPWPSCLSNLLLPLAFLKSLLNSRSDTFIFTLLLRSCLVPAACGYPGASRAEGRQGLFPPVLAHSSRFRGLPPSGEGAGEHKMAPAGPREGR